MPKAPAETPGLFYGEHLFTKQNKYGTISLGGKHGGSNFAAIRHARSSPFIRRRGTMTNSAQPTAIDLFCGAGGLSEGFRQAGYRVLAGNDIDRYAAETFRATHGDAEFIEGPIKSITATKLLRAAGLAKGELDCLLGGPPCQGYSVYNHQRGMHNSRSRLFEEYLRIVAGVMPRYGGCHGECDWYLFDRQRHGRSRNSR